MKAETDCRYCGQPRGTETPCVKCRAKAPVDGDEYDMYVKHDMTLGYRKREKL